MPRSRETMIALRATRTAHRVASDVAYPELHAVPPQPVLPNDCPVLDHDLFRLRAYQPSDNEFTAKDILVFLLVISIMIGFVIWAARS